MKGTKTAVGSGRADKPNRCLTVVKGTQRWELNRIKLYLGSNCNDYGRATKRMPKTRVTILSKEKNKGH